MPVSFRRKLIPAVAAALLPTLPLSAGEPPAAAPAGRPADGLPGEAPRRASENRSVPAPIADERTHTALRVEIPVTRRKASVEDLRRVTEESLRQVEALREKLDRKGLHPRILRVLPEPEGISAADFQPLSPPTPVGRGEAFDDFAIFQGTDLFATIPGGFVSRVAEPSAAAAAGDRVFYTLNWHAADSTDAGASFSAVDPFTGPFPPVNAGFCCDQLTVHDPASDTLFYLQQYIEDGTSGTQRINVDQGFDGTFDCFYDINPQMFIWGPGDWLDFPDLAVGETFLYHSSNVFDSGFEGAFVARYPLADLASCSPLASEVFTDTGYCCFKLSQGADDSMYFADHNTTASMRVWRWLDTLGAPTSVDRAVTAWSNATRVCPGPDGRDWCGFIDFRMAGAYSTADEVGFMWVPAQDGGFPFPYTRVARFDRTGLTLTGEEDIWNADTAFVYPSVAPNRRDHLGGTIMFGGGATLFPSCAAYMADEFNGGVFAPLENSVVVSGTSGPSSNRSGDYLRTNAHSTFQDTWAGTCFGYLSTSAGRPHYVWFGREISDPVEGIFWDRFEGGDLGLWSGAVGVSP